jgi:hypothetical protein
LFDARFVDPWAAPFSVWLEFAPKVKLVQLDALGQTRDDFAVLAHTLPSSAHIDGWLGLDFLRGQLLTLDFRAGEIMLA